MYDNDSRRAALKWYRRLRLNWIFTTSTFAGNFLIALLLTFLFAEQGHGEAVDFVFFIAVLSIGLWITEAIPPFAVGIFIIAMLSFGFGTDYILEESAPVEKYLGTWTSNVIWLLLGGFFLAKAMSIVHLDRALFKFTLNRFGDRPERLLLGLMVTTALGSMVMSNTATTAMMVSSVVPLVLVLGKDASYSKALLIGIPAAASVGGIGTIIGSTPNAIAVGALQEKGIYITFVEWMVVGFPVGLILVYFFWRFLVKYHRIKGISIDLSSLKQEEKKIDPFKRRAVIFTLAATILLWVTEPLHGIPVAASSALPMVLLTLTQVITAEHVRALPWDTLMLVAGGLGMGIAIVDVGLADIVMQAIYLLPFPVFVLPALFALIGVLLSNVMSNTAAASILVPLAIALPMPYGLAAPVIVAIACSCSLLLPVSTPSNAISFGTGLIEQKDFRPGGFYFIVAGPLAAIISVLLWVLFYM
nr:DASS family sodium-coupled anion symporter [Saprospiraceae bacterium]